MVEKRDDADPNGGEGEDGTGDDGGESVEGGPAADVESTNAGSAADVESASAGTSTGGETPPDGAASGESDDAGDRGDLLVHAFVGAAATVLVGFVPFAPVFGGALAGYLHGRDGARVGAVSDVVASIPAAFFVLLILGIVSLGTIVADQLRAAFFFLGLFLFAVLFLVVYVVGLSVLGGLVGVELADESGR